MSPTFAPSNQGPKPKNTDSQRKLNNSNKAVLLSWPARTRQPLADKFGLSECVFWASGSSGHISTVAFIGCYPVRAEVRDHFRGRRQSGTINNGTIALTGPLCGSNIPLF